MRVGQRLLRKFFPHPGEREELEMLLWRPVSLGRKYTKYFC